MPADAAAWDDLGHRIVCEIAFRAASDDTRRQIGAMLRHDVAFARFSEACTWPDHPRSRPAEHYVNPPRGSGDIALDTCPSSGKCILAAIAEDHARLASPTASPDDRLAALKYLGHWIGDVHQPFHVSFPDDRGGNDIIVSGYCAGSLHEAWDDCLVAMTLGDDVGSIASRLHAEVTPAQREQWPASGPAAWAAESHAVVTGGDVHYCVPRSDGCWYASDNRSFDAGEPVRTVIVDQPYVAKAAPLLGDRLKRAGIRLAHLLDQALRP